MAVFEEIPLREELELSPYQYDIWDCKTSTIVACGGRRLGKTHVGVPKIFSWVHEEMDRLYVEVAEGRRPRWVGEGLDRHEAATMEPDVICWIVAPREKHLTKIKGAIRSMYLGEGARWLHPTIHGLYNKGKQLWIWQDGVAGLYDFRCAASESSVVAEGVRVIWIEESGLLDNAYYDAMLPVAWDFDARMLCSGNPEVSDVHWFTKLCKSGLDPGHERFDPKVPRNPSVTTFIGDTIRDAFLRSCREKALQESRYKGELWTLKYIRGDWRQKALSVYRKWRDSVHVVPIRRSRWWEVGPHTIKRPPDTIDGTIDWSEGASPGAAVVNWIWHETPLDPDDTRPLIVSVEDYEGHDAYADSGWWRILRDMENQWGVDRWIPDPHSPRLVRAMRQAGFYVKEGPWQDKSGRIQLMAAQLHYDTSSDPPVVPAYYCSPACENLIRQFNGYRFQRKRWTGEVSSKPKQFDDHCLDCLAMEVSAECEGPGLTQIGYDYY